MSIHRAHHRLPPGARAAGIALSVAALLAAGTACGAGSSPTSVTQPSPSTVTATSTVTETVTQAPTESEQSSPESMTSTTTEAEAGTITVPNAVGKNYQQAQDMWRAAGLHVMPATDATGANRLPLIDSNWVVLSQDPKAGAKVPMDSPITATVKKYTDN